MSIRNQLAFGKKKVAIPNAADALFLLNSVSGNNMVDSINGWLFPITNKDWTNDEWVNASSLLPFKTLATISAPTSGTAKDTIRTYDTENFWYQPDGTPNNIPAQAFFQNINFANRYFCRHTTQVLNSVLREKTPAGVTDIALYKSAQTIDSNFSTYYGSEVILPTTNVMFVKTTGSDATGTGTFANPYKTIDKGLISLPTTHTLWVCNGIYNEATSGFDYLRLNRNSTTLNVKGAGSCVIRSANSTYIIYGNSSSQTINFNRVVIDGQGTQKQIYLNTAGAAYNNSKIINARVGNGALGSFENNAVVGNFTLLCPTASNTICDGVFTHTHSAQGKITNLYSKYTNQSGNGLLIGTLASSFDAMYSTFKTSGYGVNIAGCRVRTANHLATIENNVFNCKNSSAFINPSDISATAKFKTYFRYNKIVDENTSSDLITYGINCTGSNTIMDGGEIMYNYMKSSNTSAIRYAVSINPTNAYGIWKINKNRLFQDSFQGAIIFFGEGTTGSCDGSEIIGNSVTGHLVNYPANDTAGTHGILANGGINFTIKNNLIQYCALGLVVKANVGGQYTANGVFSNVLYNNKDHFYFRRVGSLPVYNNTFANSSIVPSRFGSIDSQGYAGSCRGISFKNNIFKGNVKSGVNFQIHPDALDGVNDVKFDNNIFDTTENKMIYNMVDTYYTFDQCATNLWYLNGSRVSPSFNNLSAGELWLTSGSAGDGDGTTLTGYDFVLDKTTNFNANIADEEPSNYPSIVNKSQVAAWDKGCYVN